ncbi:hypothetical protein FISHEDRAFT_37276 [Fistulina hepatica ATCC 64428]|uniref:Mitochondrial import inner membrane translocase subunit Tim21 n=1 Tax=Fistulina hepatica ATCC 64428 TaxID=1128425 RepID=A0A0D7AHW5_9AGAR|nr:hypothetical protein FISHEDRAFT_37276 [Fistulina hepatica ATCC 64428]
MRASTAHYHASSPLGQRSTLDTPSLSQLVEEQKHKPPRNTIGPFQLGLRQSAPHDKIQSWSQLSTAGKMKRTTVQTKNLTVILLGAGLATIIIYCLATELFSTNSPTVLYKASCERIAISPKVAKYLQGPLDFHSTPPTDGRPRHRNRQILSQIAYDSSGREHMLLNFYVEGRLPGYASSDLSYTEWVAKWFESTFNEVSEMTLEDVSAKIHEHTTNVIDGSRNMFRYLAGAPTPSSRSVDNVEPADPSTMSKSQDHGSWLGIFSNLKFGVADSRKPSVDMFTEGEAHADLVRNADGYFVFRYLLVDLPSTHAHNHVRVFVERAPGVRENEAVMTFRRS